MPHPLVAELPRARTEPLDGSASAFAAMTKAERRLAEEFLGAQEEVLFAVRTGSRVDTGSWLRPPRLWVLALRGELALLAHGPRPHAQRIPFAQLQQSTYNPVTGQLALAPAPHLRVRGLSMPPLEGYQLLAQILGNRESGESGEWDSHGSGGSRSRGDKPR